MFSAAKRFLLCTLSFWLLPLTGAAQNQPSGATPDAQEGVGFEEHLGDFVPGDVLLRDEQGNSVQVGSFYDGTRPVILNFAYHTCPMLCHMVLDGLVEGMRDLDWTPGDQFRVLTVSIAPTESPVLAREQKAKYLERYTRPEAAAGWHFLTGDEDQIQRLAETAGFGYKWDEATEQYSHAAGIILTSPEGKITRYFYGISYPQNDLKVGLYEAADGQVGTTMEKVFLWCFQYDPNANSYAMSAMRLMQIGGSLFALLLVLSLFWLWRRESRKKDWPTLPQSGTNPHPI